ncbi:MAG: hypothetical protein HZC24_02620 [Rhodocyclales bacterium]|nr:hypothetical protein [Rhodocyclales bacterium]
MKHSALVCIGCHPESPLLLNFDVAAEFRFGFFDYSGTGYAPPIDAAAFAWSRRTAGKGELMAAAAALLDADAAYYGFLDDDIELAVSDINRLLDIGRRCGLDVFQPSLSADSYGSFAHLFNDPGVWLRETSFVEVMMPFFSNFAFSACKSTFGESISGWGLDFIWSSRMARQGRRLAVVHDVVAAHRRPSTSTGWKFANGMTSWDELAQIKARHGLLDYRAS